MLSRSFTSIYEVDDNHPRLTLFGEHKSLPTLAAAHIQQWAIILIFMLMTTTLSSTCLKSISRCPLPETSDTVTAVTAATVHSLLAEHPQGAPLNATQVAGATHTDSGIS